MVSEALSAVVSGDGAFSRPCCIASQVTRRDVGEPGGLAAGTAAAARAGGAGGGEGAGGTSGGEGGASADGAAGGGTSSVRIPGRGMAGMPDHRTLASRRSRAAQSSAHDGACEPPDLSTAATKLGDLSTAAAKLGAAWSLGNVGESGALSWAPPSAPANHA